MEVENDIRHSPDREGRTTSFFSGLTTYIGHSGVGEGEILLSLSLPDPLIPHLLPTFCSGYACLAHSTPSRRWVMQYCCTAFVQTLQYLPACHQWCFLSGMHCYLGGRKKVVGIPIHTFLGDFCLLLHAFLPCQFVS